MSITLRAERNMRIHLIYRFVIVLLLAATAGNLSAQDIVGGTVKYQQTQKNNFASVFGEHDNPRVAAWVASLPAERQSMRVLYFTENKALYEEDLVERKILDRRLQRAYERAEYMRPPSTQLQKVYYDFGKNERIEQLEFMTRDFLVSDIIEKKAWRLTNKHTRILDYTCLGAELKTGEHSITAWFTSEIPILAGPDRFYGLPGLILAVEVHGETAFLATSVDLTPPAEGVLSKPDEGRKITRKKLNRIVEEKIEEYKALGNEDMLGRRRRR
jgi:GLPGLI family protein